MHKLLRARVTFLVLTALCVSLAPHADAQPRKKEKAATQEDIQRLERRLEEQQKVIDRLTKLHQQLAAVFDGQVASTPPAPAPVADKPVDKPADRPTDKPVIEAKPAVAIAPSSMRTEPKLIAKPKKPDGVGTIVGKITGAPNAIVYVETVSESSSGTAAMKQEGKQFLPQTLVVQKGTTVQFPNRDAIFHNVFSLSPDHTFDLGSYRQGESKSVKMSRSGVVTVYCNMHPQMVGHILVVPSSKFARAGKDGFFRITDVPAGPHRIVAWAPNSKPISANATVADAEVVTVELEIKKGRPGPHTKKDGLPYGSYEQ